MKIRKSYRVICGKKLNMGGIASKDLALAIADAVYKFYDGRYHAYVREDINESVIVRHDKPKV